MTKHNLTIYKNISRACTIGLSYLLVFITVLTIYEQQITKPHFLIGIPVLLVSYLLIERYCFQVVLYFLLHGIFLVPILLIPYPNMCYKILYILFFFFEFSHACYIWRTGSDPAYNELPWFLFLFVAVLYIAGRMLHQNTFADYVYYIGLALILLHFVRYFIYGSTLMFQEAERTTSMPTRKIMLTNFALLGMLLLGFLLLGITIRFLHLDQFLFTIGDVLVTLFCVFIRFLLYLIALLRMFLSSDKAGTEPVAAAEDLQQAVQQIPKTPIWVEIITVLLQIALILFAIFILYRIIRFAIRSLLARYTSDSDIIVPLNDKIEKVKQCEPKVSLVQKAKEIFDSSYRAKIRRFYRIRIRQSRELSIRKNDTPSDIARQMRKVYDEDIDSLTEVYEKARYSNREITIDDAKKGGIL